MHKLMNDYLLGVEIGGTKLQLAIGDESGRLLHVEQGRVKAGDGARGILLWLENNIPGVIAKSRDFGGRIAGIGVGFGGPVETSTGRVLASMQIHGWENFKIRNWFEDKFKLPAVVNNDSNAACWGEYRNGFGAGTSNFCYMNIGSGIGGGLVIEGRLHDGQGFGAAEFGHTYVPDWTVGDVPGAAQKLELLCSGWSIEQRLRRPGYVPERSALMRMCCGEIGAISCATLGAAAEGDDDFAKAEIDRVARSVAIVLSSVLAIICPERIAMGGGVSGLGEILLAPLRAHLKKYEFINSSGRYELEKCRLDESIVLVGAILLLKDRLARA